jgi:hypothetical protein
MKRIIYIFFIAIMAAACVKEQNKDEFGSDAIGFSPVADATKANVSIDDDAALQADGFGVYAYYTGTNNFVSPNDATTTLGTMLSNDHVSYSSGWIYTPTQYWPENGRKVSFFAYAPWTLWNGAVTPNATTGMPEIPYTASTDLGNQKDLLWGVGEDGYPLKNMTKPTDMTAHFHFRHALCRLHFNIADFEDLASINSSINNSNYVFVPRANNPGKMNSPKKGDARYIQTGAVTKIVIESLTISGLYANGTLSLDNTSTEPQWLDKGKGKSATERNLSYSLTFPSTKTIDYTNDDDLKNNWSSLTQITSTQLDLLGSDKFIYAIPRDADESGATYPIPAMTIAVKYHVITYYHYYYEMCNNSNRDWYTVNNVVNEYRINRENDGTTQTGITVTATSTFAIQGNHDETFNIEINGKYLDLKVKANPWTVNEDELSYNSGTVTVSESNRIHWTDNTFDVLDGSNLYISTKTASCTFTISNPARYLWSATLIPVAGNASAFMFVDADGNEIENPNGAVGDLATLRIKARKETTTVQNKAILRIFVKTATGSEVAFATGYNGTTEYTIIQDAN